MTLQTSVERHALPLDAAFTISRGTTDTADVLTVEIADGEGHTGYGGAAPSAYYGETPDSVADTLPDILEIVETIDDPHDQQRIERHLHGAAPDQPAARAAVSIAVHDLAARQAGEPLYRRWGLDPAETPSTSYTVSIANPETMAARAADVVAAGYPVLKIKLGTDDDRARLEAVRKAAPDATIRVDANAAWTPDEAIAALDWLEGLDVELLEQPVAAEDVAGLARVRDATRRRDAARIPIAADESCVVAGDVPDVADAVDVVVAKLMKCGGLRDAVAQIATAHAHDLDVMLGCMVESNASIAAGWHLSPLVEYADLDGSLLLAEDPFDGVPITGGGADLAALSSAAGSGATRR